MFYYTYVLKGRDNFYYIGFTVDLVKRIQAHNEGKVRSTKTNVPLKLIYYEACLSKRKAVEREKQLKTGYGRMYLSRRIDF